MLKKIKSTLFVLGIILLLLDQAMKLIILKYYPQCISYNNGIFFGSVQNSAMLYVFLVLGILVLFFLFLKSGHKYYLPLTVIVAGAISNIIDRFLYPGVLDYINLGFWSNFNLADLYILAGAIWYLILIFMPQKSKISN